MLGMEARGFIVGTPVAIRLGVGFIMLRKPNKLPGAKISLDFYKEYSPDAKVLRRLEIKHSHSQDLH